MRYVIVWLGFFLGPFLACNSGQMSYLSSSYRQKVVNSHSKGNGRINGNNNNANKFSLAPSVMPLNYYQLQNSFNAIFSLKSAPQGAQNPLLFAMEKLDGSTYSTVNVSVPSEDNLGNLFDYVDLYYAATSRQLKAMFSCSFGEDMSVDCIDDFIQKFGTKAFRRPLEDDEVSQYTAVFQNLSRSDPDSALRGCVQGLLLSPNHLFMTVIGKDGYLTEYEKASLISFSATEAPPTDALLAKAVEGKLDTDRDVLATVTELVKANRVVIARFIREHFAIVDTTNNMKSDRSNLTFMSAPPSGFTDAMGVELTKEAQLFIEQIVAQESPNFATLLGAEKGYVSSATANIYGVANAGNAPSVTNFPIAQRKGILSLPGVIGADALANVAHPLIQRGKFIRQQLLCTLLGPPATPNQAMLGMKKCKAKTDREDSNCRLANPDCAPCHVKMDPIGLAFQNFGSIGEILGTADSASYLNIDSSKTSGVAVKNGYDMAQNLLVAPEVMKCLAKRSFSYISAGLDDNCNTCDPEQMLNNVEGDLVAYFSQAITYYVNRKVQN